MEQKTTNVNGVLITGYEQDYVFQRIETSGDFYEGDLLRAWTPMLKEPRVIFDIGANLGNHSLYWADNLKPEKIYAFEPYSPNFVLLKKNIEANCPGTVENLNLAVGAEKGFVSVKSSDDENMGATAFENAVFGVGMISLDSFCAENNIVKVDFVKIDTEGFEIEVIRGMKNLLLMNRPNLWIETESKNCEELSRLLEPYDYVLAGVSGANLLFLSSSRYDEVNEIKIEYVLQNMLMFLEKTNTYYKNYEKTKGNLHETQNKYKLAAENYDLAKTKLSEANESISKLNEEIQRIYAEQKSIVDKHIAQIDESKNMLRELVLENDESVSLLLEAQREIKQLRVQRDYLKRENEEQKSKLSRIYDTRYGRFVLRCYKLLKKCWQPVKKMKSKFFN